MAFYDSVLFACVNPANVAAYEHSAPGGEARVRICLSPPGPASRWGNQWRDVIALTPACAQALVDQLRPLGFEGREPGRTGWHDDPPTAWEYSNELGKAERQRDDLRERLAALVVAVRAYQKAIPLGTYCFGGPEARMEQEERWRQASAELDALLRAEETP